MKTRQSSDVEGSDGSYSERVELRPRILFVEDERSISEPFSHALEREGFEPVVAKTAAEALQLADRIDPALVLLDLMLPDGDGRDVCRELRRRSDRPIIMLTARGTETDRIVGLELGADDYVVKPFSGPEVIARIRAVLRRSAAASGQDRLLRVGDLEADLGSRRVTLDSSEVELSRKEFDLLVALMSRAGRVVRREDLMSEVWDENWFGSTKTLDTHIGWLRRKLSDDPAAPRFIHTVRGVGFRFSAAEEIAR
ncbi:MAG TPA: response regulator transcription factor [Thermoleophilaceae bacterium]